MKVKNYSSTNAFIDDQKKYSKLFLRFLFQIQKNSLKVLLAFSIFHLSPDLVAQTPLSATDDSLCSVQCCQASQPGNSTAGVNVTGELPAYSYLVYAGLA